MYTLLELKDIKRKYKLNENGNIELTGKEEAKSASEMTDEERSYIGAALFLYRQVKTKKDEIFNNLSEEEFLEQMQTQFTTEVLNSREHTEYSISIATTPGKVIWRALLGEGETNAAMTYFYRIFAENGKKLERIQMGRIGGLSSSIKYDFVDDKVKLGNFLKEKMGSIKAYFSRILNVQKTEVPRLNCSGNHALEDSKEKFQQDLDSNNPIYTQNAKPKELTQEQRQKRRQFVDKLMEVYRQFETDENYEDRKNREDSDMSFVVDIVNNKGTIYEVVSENVMMNLLYAAKNISLDGQTDYLEALIDQPKINEILLKMRNKNRKSNDILDNISQIKKDNGMSVHKLTKAEVSIREANALIREKPMAVEIARQKLNERDSFKINKGDTKNLRRARLIEVVARTQGKTITKTVDSQGNRLLQVDDSRERVE